MDNKKDYKEEKFDYFLNKIIIFSSKKYYKKQVSLASKEETIVDNENYSLFLQDFIMNNCAIFNVDKVEKSVELNSALHSLSEIEQAVIFLLFNKELSQDEAGKILEICSKSVSRIKLRAINKLKEYLEGDSKNEK